MTAKTAGRSGRPWRRLRKQILEASTICWICGHDGADSLDHLIPRSIAIAAGRMDLLSAPGNLAPAHHLPCPACGIRCNTSRGTGQPRRQPKPSRDW